MTPISALHDLYYRHHRAHYPNVPAVAIPKPTYTDRTTNGLTRMVYDYIRFSGGLVERINVMGRQIKAKNGREIWIPTSGVRGSADLSAIYQGKSLRIEIKCAATHDRIRPKQVEYARRVEQSGGLFKIVRTFDEFHEWFMQLQ